MTRFSPPGGDQQQTTETEMKEYITRPMRIHAEVITQENIKQIRLMGLRESPVLDAWLIKLPDDSYTILSDEDFREAHETIEDATAFIAGQLGEFFTPGSWEIAMERRRQIQTEGWTEEHDDEHQEGDLNFAAVSYALAAHEVSAHGEMLLASPKTWPWGAQWWKPGTAKRMLEKAGALLAAEWERLDRAEKSKAALANLRFEPGWSQVPPPMPPLPVVQCIVCQSRTAEPRTIRCKECEEKSGFKDESPVTTQICPCCRNKRPLTMDSGECCLCHRQILTCCLEDCGNGKKACVACTF